MSADCLTKQMKGDFLYKVLETNQWNYKQPEEAKELKSRKQQGRRKGGADIDEGCDTEAMLSCPDPGSSDSQ